MPQSDISGKITGKWSKFDIQLIGKQNTTEILGFLTENFHREEPIGQLCPFDREFIDDTNSKIAKLLESSSSISLIATDTETDKVAGVLLQFEWKQEDAQQQQKAANLNQQHQPKFRQRQVIDAIYKSLNETRYGLFEKYGVNKLIWNFVAATSKEHRGQGLASEMYRRMVSLLKAENHTLVFSIFSSPFSRKCAEKAGFIEVARSRFCDAVDIATGLPLFPGAAAEEDFASIMVLKMN